jgi:ribosome-associated protein
MGRKRKTNTEKLIEIIIEAIREKKGNNILNLNLTKLNNPVCRNFIVCYAESNTQVNAIADCVEMEVKNKLMKRSGKKKALKTRNGLSWITATW